MINKNRYLLLKIEKYYYLGNIKVLSNGTIIFPISLCQIASSFLLGSYSPQP